jgi:asparagine synthase (glutamine-hydrolysing)
MTVLAPAKPALFLGSPRLDGRAVNADELAMLVSQRGATAVLAALDGEFALALTLDDGSTLLAVDRFAVHTLCWRVVGGELHVAARADELARIEPVAAVEPQAIFEYLYFHAIASPRTVFQGVMRLPPAHLLRFERGAVRVEPYWVPTFQEPSDGSFDKLATEFRRVLKRAVASQLDGTKAACYLSGGTDSSTVAGMIREATGKPAASYSIGFEAEGYDEMAYARIAARRFGCEHHEHYVTPAELVQAMPLVARHYDQPFGNSSALPAYYCAKMARADGVSRVLAGDGGDELFGGNARYAKQRVFGWYGAVPSPLRGGVVEPLLLASPLGRAPLLKKGASYVQQARVPMPDRLDLYNLLSRVGPAEVLSAELLAQVDTQAPLAQQREVWASAVAGSAVNRTLAFDWRYTLAENDLPKVVGSAALAGVAVGFPFLQREVLALSMRLPPSYKLKGLKLRWFFKEALRGFLPDEIITKKKHGFGLPFGVWALRDAGLRELARESVQALVARGVVRAGFERRLFDELLPAHPGYYGELVWLLTMLEQWLRGHAPGFSLRG